jgi:hypothetical protein
MIRINDETFTQQVRKSFLFLQAKYGMHIEENEIAGCVRFKSKIAWIEIRYDRYSLFIEIGTNDGLYQTSLWDIMQYATGEGKAASYMASDEEKLRKGLQRLSDYVNMYGHEALSGNVEFYKQIQKNRETLEKTYAAGNRIDNIEELAKAAWEKQDYIEIINLYESISEHLSPLQRKRLSISKKRLSATPLTHALKSHKSS